MPRPTLREQARKIRLAKGLSQSEAARILGKSLSYVVRLEQGDFTRDEERAYRDRLATSRKSHRRTPGGAQKVSETLWLERSSDIRTGQKILARKVFCGNACLNRRIKLLIISVHHYPVAEQRQIEALETAASF